MNAKTKFAGIAASLLLATAACTYFFAGKSAPGGSDARTVPADEMAGGKIAAAPTDTAQTKPAPAAQYPDGVQSSGLNAGQIAALGRLEKMLEDGLESPDDILRPIRVWAKGNKPAECAEWIAANLTGATRDRCLEETLAEWSLHSPKEALAWLDKQPSAEGNDGAYLNALANFSHSDTAASAAWLKEHPALSSVETWQIVACAWAETDGKAGLAWLNKNLDPDIKDNMLVTLLSTFRDPGTAQALLAGTSAETASTSLTAAAEASALERPAFAISLAEKISDDAARKALTEKILSGWMGRDADAAKAFLSRGGQTR